VYRLELEVEKYESFTSRVVLVPLLAAETTPDDTNKKIKNNSTINNR